jgi:hypothetical protein
MNELVKAVGLAIGATDLPEAGPPSNFSANVRPPAPAPTPPADDLPPFEVDQPVDAYHRELVELKEAVEDFPFRLLTACREAARVTNAVEQWERFERAVDAFVSARA